MRIRLESSIQSPNDLHLRAMKSWLTFPDAEGVGTSPAFLWLILSGIVPSYAEGSDLEGFGQGIRSRIRGRGPTMKSSCVV